MKSKNNKQLKSQKLLKLGLWALTLSPRFSLSAFEHSLSSSSAFKPLLSLRAPLSSRFFFECAFEPSLPFERAFEPLTILLRAPSSPHFPFFFYLGKSPIIMRPFSLYFFSTWVGHPLQWDHLKIKNKKSGSSSKWLVSWFLHISVKVVCQFTVFEVFKTKKKNKSFFYIYFSL